jgi:hypothetical protein
MLKNALCVILYVTNIFALISIEIHAHYCSGMQTRTMEIPMEISANKFTHLSLLDKDANGTFLQHIKLVMHL